jgi:hypothetical protein
MAKLRSPRMQAFDAWKPAALALLKPNARFSHVSAVLISAAIYLGKDEFCKKFGGHTTVEDFKKDVDPRRASLFSGGEKLSTAVALLCLKAAGNLVAIHANHSNDAKETLDRKTSSLQKLFEYDELDKFHKGERKELIEVLLSLIDTMALWTDPRGALLGPKTQTGSNQKFERELSVMGEMYESEPTQQEEDDEDNDKMLDKLIGVAKSVCNGGRKLVQACRGTTSPAPPPAKDWFAEFVLDGVNILQYLVWVCAMMYVCVIWIDALYSEFSSDYTVFVQKWLTRKSTAYDTAGVIYVFVMTHWSGTQTMMLFAMYVGVLSLHLAHEWPRYIFLEALSRQDIRACWYEWKDANTTTLSKYCDNQHVATRQVMHIIYYYMACAIGFMFCVDMATVVILFYRNQKIVSPGDFVVHQAFCSQACTLYLFVQHVHGVHKIVWLKHTLNFIIFGVFLCSTTTSTYENIKPKTSALSLFGCRLVCLCVCCSEFVVLYYHGETTWVSQILEKLFGETCRVYQYVLAFQILGFLYGMVNPHTLITFAGKRPTVGDTGSVVRNT